MEMKFPVQQKVLNLVAVTLSSDGERGASLVEVLVSIGILSMAIVLLGSAATLWQSGLRWPVDRMERVISVSEDLSRWPLSPIPICEDEQLLTWWEQLTDGQVEQWSAPAIWAGEQGWLPISDSECSAFPAGEISVIKLHLGPVPPGLAEIGLAEIGLAEIVLAVSRS
jgi:hypothetical protein